MPIEPGNPDIVDPNHWQPLTLQTFIDQSGNVIPINTPKFLSPEWGGVYPFSLKESDQNIYQSNGDFYSVYHDPGHPPYIDDPATKDYYIWNFTLVAVWASHLDPADSVMWDVSPASIGNNPEFPTSYADFPNFYNLEDGGDQSRGWNVNPATGQPYEPQIVPRGDYARILAEFWADGPDSETPPGHWFTLLNYVNDHPLFEKRFKGEGPILDDLEWDVKAYFIMGGTMHDVAVTSWGIKGYYDYIRPISAIRYMADQGQSSDNTKPSYSENGLPLMEGLIELVEAGDDLAGDNNENVDKIKLYTWRGPDYIDSAAIDEAGVGWILAENWWPYQRPTFITPPFAGFVSGHSTYSRAAAEVMTMLTGDAFFPGGMGEFEAPKNEFLVFEEGPSQDITLQWATYRDASDQCSLSRIWGGIHPSGR
ncbi:MAG: vanadium-dependent haloperoxidase [Chitinophagales bacterium]